MKVFNNSSCMERIDEDWTHWWCAFQVEQWRIESVTKMQKPHPQSVRSRSRWPLHRTKDVITKCVKRNHFSYNQFKWKLCGRHRNTHNNFCERTFSNNLKIVKSLHQLSFVVLANIDVRHQSDLWCKWSSRRFRQLLLTKIARFSNMVGSNFEVLIGNYHFLLQNYKEKSNCQKHPTQRCKFL